MRTARLVLLVGLLPAGGCLDVERPAGGGPEDDERCAASTCAEPQTDAGVATVLDDESVVGDEEDTNCDGSTCDWPDEWQSLEREVLLLVNEARGAGATCGGMSQPPAPPLAWDDRLADAARLHARDMAEQGYFDHNSLDGRSPWDRIVATGYTGQPAAENIAGGSSTATQVFSNWMGSSGHCRNIMAANLTEIGIGYAYLPGSPWGHYWVQTFGRR
ncbi:MAG: CAP domain-containing protein [Myxococcota bacterium]